MEAFGKTDMNCEQLDAIVLDLDRDDSLTAMERAAAAAHLSQCSRCAALQESWLAAREELRALGEDTIEAVAPARVEMRLRQEFRTRHRSMAVRRASLVAAWALAAAVLIAGAVSWRNWQQARRNDVAKQDTATQAPLIPSEAPSNDGQVSSNASSAVLSDDLADFTPLPGAAADATEQAAIMRVRMQRDSLGAFGLPVNEQRAGDWIQVDLLVGSDGLPEAVRLAQEEN
ncbi:MAG: anti-sigma factor family protein [Candidatus Acidiferrum sp.]